MTAIVKRTIRLEGLEEVRRVLRRLPEKVRNRVLRPAVRSAGGVVQKAIRKAAPKGQPRRYRGKDFRGGDLRRNITAIVRTYKTSVIAVLGPKYPTPHAQLNILGTSDRYTKAGGYRGAMKPRDFIAMGMRQAKSAYAPKLLARVKQGIEREAEKMRRSKGK